MNLVPWPLIPSTSYDCAAPDEVVGPEVQVENHHRSVTGKSQKQRIEVALNPRAIGVGLLSAMRSFLILPLGRLEHPGRKDTRASTF